MSEPISRRDAISKALGIGSISIASLMALACADTDASFGDPTWLLAALTRSDLEAIGSAYRRLTPAEQTVDALRDALATSRRGLPWSARPPLEQQVADEFAAGDTVLAEGWVLARTEARLCALVSLTARAS